MSVLADVGDAAALTGLLGATGLLAHRAVARCRASIAAGKARARRRADIALQVEAVRHPWERDTDRLAAAVAPLLDPLDPLGRTAAGATVGFGDSLVAEERMRLALTSLRPAEEIPW